MPGRWMPYHALFLTLIVVALPVNYWLRGNPFRFSVLLINVLLLAILAAAIWRRYASAFVFVSTVIASLTVIEVFFTVYEPTRTHFEGSYAAANYTTRDSPFGFGPNPGVFSSVKCRGDCATNKIYDVSYTIEAGGFRHTPQAQGAAKAGAVLFLGDSTTFGEGLNDDETLPHNFAKLRPDSAVFNLAFHGYGAHQVLRALETGHFDAYTGKKVDLIVFPTAPWQADRSACLPYYARFTPKYVVVGAEAVYAGRCPGDGVFTRVLYQSKTYGYFRERIPADLFRMDDKFELYLAIIKTTRRIAEEKYGARFVIGFLGSADSAFLGSRYSNERILQYFRENGIEFVDIALADRPEEMDPSLLIPGDGHPSARAQFLRAQLLVRFLDGGRGE